MFPFLLALLVGCRAGGADVSLPDAPPAEVAWREQGREVRLRVAGDRLRVLAAVDEAAVRRAVPEALTVEVAAEAVVIRLPPSDPLALAQSAHRLATLGEVQAWLAGEGGGWLAHRLSARLPAGADAGAIAARHRLVLVERPSYAPGYAIFASDPARLAGAAEAAAHLVAAGEALEAAPLVHRQHRRATD